MSTGLDALAAGQVPASLRHANLALLVNHTAVDRRGIHAVDIFRQQGLQVVRLLSPEHGLWSVAQDMEPVDSELDPVFGLPVFSLYGHDEHSLTPSVEAFQGIDVLVYDIQDIGARYYTYAASLAFAMRTAGSLGIKVVVLDRPNPIGPKVEGPLLRQGFESFCGIIEGMPIRHGLSMGALARYYQKALSIEVDLEVVEALPGRPTPFLPTSPNMPTFETALVYPGLCLLEGTTLSEGRGTTAPFLQFGAPGVNPVELAEALRAFPIAGVDFVPVRFRPAFGKHAGLVCGGVYLRVTQPEVVHAVNLGVYVLAALKAIAPEGWTWRSQAYEFRTDVLAIDLLWGSSELRETLDQGGDLTPLLAKAEAEAQAWRAF